VISPGTRIVALGLLVATLLTATPYASPAWDRSCYTQRGVSVAQPKRVSELPPPTLDELVAACRSAKTAFKPLSEDDLRAARSNLVAAVGRLDAKLASAGDVEQGWRDFLNWPSLAEQLARHDEVELEALDAVYARFASGHRGLNLVWFAEAREALRRYLTTARLIGDERIASQYEAVMESLPGLLAAYAESPTAEQAWTIRRTIGWLEQAGQASELIDSLHRYFAQPNLVARVSRDVIESGLGRPVDETEKVRDVILKADIYGMGHVTGRVGIALVPSAEHAVIETRMTGQIASDTVGYRGPARVYTDGLTRITVQKPLMIDAEHVWSRPAAARATTQTKIKGVRVVRGGQFVERLARRRTYAQKSEAECIAARHAEQRVSRRFDLQAAELVDDANQRLRRNFRQPLQIRRLLPEWLRFATTEEFLQVRARYRGPEGLAAAVAPPPLPEGHDVVLCLHESMVNNLAASAFAGMIVEERVLREQMTEAFGPLPEHLQPEEGEEPWAVTFADDRPIAVDFGDGRFTVTIRGRKYARGDEEYAGIRMNVSAEYRIERTGEGFKAVREGELEVFPPGFVAGEGRLSTREQVLRRLLQKKFARVFEAEWVPEPLQPADRWENVGPLVMSEWSVAGGWMLVAWQRQPAPAAD